MNMRLHGLGHTSRLTHLSLFYSADQDEGMTCISRTEKRIGPQPLRVAVIACIVSNSPEETVPDTGSPALLMMTVPLWVTKTKNPSENEACWRSAALNHQKC